MTKLKKQFEKVVRFRGAIGGSENTNALMVESVDTQDFDITAIFAVITECPGGNAWSRTRQIRGTLNASRR